MHISINLKFLLKMLLRRANQTKDPSGRRMEVVFKKLQLKKDMYFAKVSVSEVWSVFYLPRCFK